MKQTQGWTFIELILVVLLLSLLGSFVLRMAYTNTPFQEYLFVHKMVTSFNQIKGIELYAQTPVKISVKGDAVIFKPQIEGHDISWSLDAVSFVGPNALNHLKNMESMNKEISLETPNYKIILDPITHYAYLKHRED